MTTAELGFWEATAFVGKEGQIFAARHTETGQSVMMTLTSVSHQPKFGEKSYSMTFQSDSIDSLGQGTFALQLDDQPPFMLFLTPISAQEAGIVYEAIFN